MRTVGHDGLGGVVVATVAWAVCAALFLTSPADGGANIGAGIIALLAVALSVAASRYLVTAGPLPHEEPGPVPGRSRRQRSRTVGIRGARCSVAGWAGLVLLAVTGLVPPSVLTTVWAVDLLLFLTSSAVLLAAT